MDFDIFLSIAQTPVEGQTPDENTMFSNFFEQLQAADQLGFGTAWVAQAHLSTEVQKMNKNPVVAHWEGEVGLCTDFFQLAHIDVCQDRENQCWFRSYESSYPWRSSWNIRKGRSVFGITWA